MQSVYTRHHRKYLQSFCQIFSLPTLFGGQLEFYSFRYYFLIHLIGRSFNEDGIARPVLACDYTEEHKLRYNNADGIDGGGKGLWWHMNRNCSPWPPQHRRGKRAGRGFFKSRSCE